VGLRGPHLGIEVGGAFPLESSPGRAILEKRTVHLEDILQELHWHAPDVQAGVRRAGLRTIVAVPLLREQTAIGAIVIRRLEVRPFSEKQIRLIQTFADQAVIAIENVRLFTELQEKNQALTQAHAQVTESLEQQTATAEILRVIAASPTELRPVFDAIVENARRLCDAFIAALFGVEDGALRLVSHHGWPPPALELARRIFPMPLTHPGHLARTIAEARIYHVSDALGESGLVFQQAVGYRSLLLVPLIREGRAVGVISVARAEPRPFTDKQIALLKTFADQAVIAIENVRLFTELQTSNRDLSTTLEQQTATSELLKVIGRSTFDLQPVFETLAENAVRLCAARLAFIYRFDGQRMRSVASYNVSDEMRAFVEQNPIAPGRHTATARAALERRTIHIRDVRADSEYTYGAKEIETIRTVLVVPMLRAGELLGVIQVYRHEVRPFSDGQVALMETFADQAAIAIENARLLSELRDRTAELTRSVGELTALSEVGRAVSSTLDVQTVLDTIVARAVELSGVGGGYIYEYDDAAQEFHVRATYQVEDELADAFRAEPIRLGEGATGRAAATRVPVQITDTLDEREYTFVRIRSILARLGYRSVLAVPLLLEQRVLGALVVQRREVGSFAPEVVNLLQTFATQSALAIQNARLFREIEQKSRQLEVASHHKSEFLANMSHELRTPLNAIIGFSEVMTDRMFGDLNEKQDEYLKDIYASGTHLLSLINDILDLSKIEAGRMELELTDFDLPTALDNALMLVRERAQRRSLTLHKDVDAGLGQIQGDERKIRQVVLNLLSNAIKFTPEGGRIELAAVPKDGCVEVSVSDTGVGIAPEDQEKVFEEFRQVGTADKKAEGQAWG
jgi:two-component system, NtrC family, sensor kinase